MIKCPSCHKGMLRQDYGQPIECGECSAIFERYNGGLKIIPPDAPKPAGYKLTPQQRRSLFFDRLVAGQSSQQIADALRAEGIINVCESTVRNYRDNHYEEINAAKKGIYPKIRIVTPAGKGR